MKKQLVVLSAAAMVAAAAVPALAFENEFHGMYRLRANVTNYQAKGAAIDADGQTSSLFEQRARLQYIAKASDELKLVTFFEIDSTWGDAAYNNSRGAGAGAGGDSVNLETKNVYLDFKLPSTPVQMKVGLQGWGDAYKGIIYNNDLAGAVAIGKFDPVTATAAFFRAYERNVESGTSWGKKNVDLYILDAKFALNKDTNLGASYYNFYNDADEQQAANHMTHTVGLNAAAKLGIVGLDAFALYQFGDALYGSDASNDNHSKDLSAYAAQVAVKADLGMAAIRGALLYTSGDDGDDSSESNAFQVVQENAVGAFPATFAGQGGNYYSSQMMLLFRNVFNMDSDQAIVPNLNNGDHGVMAGFLGADFKLNDKFSANVNLGTAFNAEERGTEDEDYLGTEVNLSLNYKLYPTLTATLQGAYLMLGDYYDAPAGNDDPDDLYLAGLMLNYTF